MITQYYLCFYFVIHVHYYQKWLCKHLILQDPAISGRILGMIYGGVPQIGECLLSTGCLFHVLRLLAMHGAWDQKIVHIATVYFPQTIAKWTHSSLGERLGDTPYSA